MVRLIVWTAAMWTVIVFFAGCSRLTPEAAPGDQNGQWIKAESRKIHEARKAKEPPITAATYYTAGLLLENQGDIPGAVAKYVKAISLDARYTSAYNHLGICYMRMRTYDAAEETFKQALQQTPDLAYLHNNLGFCYLLQHKYLNAEAEFRNALTADPKFLRAHANLGVTLVKLGKAEEGLSHFRQSCSPPEAYYNVGMILHAQGKLDQAKKYYELALKASPQFEPATKALAQLKQDKEPAGDKLSMTDRR